MQYTVQAGLSVEALRSSVPARYRSRLPGDLPDQSYSLVLFRNHRRDVVLSRVVESAGPDRRGGWAARRRRGLFHGRGVGAAPGTAGYRPSVGGVPLDGRVVPGHPSASLSGVRGRA